MVETRNIETAPGMVFDASVAGLETAPLVLMLHGFCVSRHFWDNQIPALAEAGCFVVAPNQRGYAAGARLGDDPGLVVARPRPSPADARDHLQPADADNPVGFECRVETTHKSISQSRERSSRPAPPLKTCGQPTAYCLARAFGADEGRPDCRADMFFDCCATTSL
jgi:pimeloyl-ACP methyl ester carboxylesterase